MIKVKVSENLYEEIWLWQWAVIGTFVVLGTFNFPLVYSFFIGAELGIIFAALFFEPIKP